MTTFCIPVAFYIAFPTSDKPGSVLTLVYRRFSYSDNRPLGMYDRLLDFRLVIVRSNLNFQHHVSSSGQHLMLRQMVNGLMNVLRIFPGARGGSQMH